MPALLSVESLAHIRRADGCPLSTHGVPGAAGAAVIVLWFANRYTRHPCLPGREWLRGS